MKLRLGRMTTKELAAWMGIKYNTFRVNSEKRYTLLEQYCSYTKEYGGVNIQEIYEYEFKGDLKRQYAKIYLEEAMEAENHLTTTLGMARKVKKERPHCQELKVNTLRNSLSKGGNEIFGKTNFPDDRFAYKGPYGYREYVWGVKLSDYNQYRYLTEEEEKRFDELLAAAYALPAEKAKTMALLDQSLKDKQIEIDDYFSKREELDLCNFKGVLQAMFIEFGIIIVKCTYHEITKEPRESIF